MLRRYVDRFAAYGPEFADVCLDGQTLISRDELRRMYASEFRLLSPAQRLIRMRATLDSRIASWEERLYKQYEQSFAEKYNGKELVFVTRMAVSQKLQPVRMQLKNMLELRGDQLFRTVMQDAPKPLREAYEENQEAVITWWEDAVAEAYMLVRLGFAGQDKTVYHLLVDEAQDYSETALALLHAYLPNARVTLLGDPMQRTCPGMPVCRPENWGDCFGVENAPVFHLTRCYRSSLPIGELCNAILPGEEKIQPFGREGEKPLVAQYSLELLKQKLDEFRAAGHKSIAVITRTQAQADSLSAKLENVYRLDGGEADLNYESTDNVVSCYHLTKGLEFDAVIVVWPDCELTDDERRRLYTACSRALHSAALLGGGKLIQELGFNDV